MRKLSFADRCSLFFIASLAIAGIFVGTFNWLKNGYSSDSVIFILIGSVVMTVIFSCLLFTKILNNRSVPDSSTSTSSPSGADDPPPNYRLTWRKEFLQTSPSDLKADLEKALGPNAKKAKGAKRNGNIQQIWTSDMAAGVHDVNWFFSAGPAMSATGPRGLQYPNIHPGRPQNLSFHSLTLQNEGFPPHTEPSYSRSFHVSPIVAINREDAINNQDLEDEGLPSYEEVQRWF